MVCANIFLVVAYLSSVALLTYYLPKFTDEFEENVRNNILLYGNQTYILLLITAVFSTSSSILGWVTFFRSKINYALLPAFAGGFLGVYSMLISCNFFSVI